MLVAITGTPGVGKSSVSDLLKNYSYNILDIFSIAIEKDFVIEEDKKRDSKILDINKINKFLKKNYDTKDIIFVDSHLSHMFSCVDYVIILRCNPKILKKRLLTKGWIEEKINENIESEILDIILCETIDKHQKENIFEIDTSNKSLKAVVRCIREIIKNDFKPMKKYNIGMIDWSEEILKDF